MVAGRCRCRRCSATIDAGWQISLTLDIYLRQANFYTYILHSTSFIVYTRITYTQIVYGMYTEHTAHSKGQRTEDPLPEQPGNIRYNFVLRLVAFSWRFVAGVRERNSAQTKFSSRQFKCLVSCVNRVVP